jgi:hypothetical protein
MSAVPGSRSTLLYALKSAPFANRPSKMIAIKYPCYEDDTSVTKPKAPLLNQYLKELRHLMTEHEHPSRMMPEN